MKYDDRFPDTARLESPEDAPGVMQGGEETPCWHCGQPTTWLDLCFEAPICSEECDAAKTNEWVQAERAAARYARLSLALRWAIVRIGMSPGTKERLQRAVDDVLTDADMALMEEEVGP